MYQKKNVIYEVCWDSIERSLSSLYNLNGCGKVAGMEIYQNVYDLCTAYPDNYSSRLFYDIVEWVERKCDDSRVVKGLCN